MNHWEEDLLNLLVVPAACVQEVFSRVEKAAKYLGFDYVAYGLQANYPITKPQVTLLNNYPHAWQHHYQQAGYLQADPTVAHGRKSTTPIVWSDELFASATQLWTDARDAGLRVGWAQSCVDGLGVGSMLTLSRGEVALSSQELSAQERHMRWLVQVAHVTCSKVLNKQATTNLPHLSPREREVLQWTADGKSAQDIADILSLSKHAIDFHIKNSMSKLQVPNKTAAVARAALLGLLA